MTEAEFQAWAERPDSVRCLLIEVAVRSGGTETTRYLSNVGYVTGAADTPANAVYDPCIVGGVSVTETLPLDGSASLSWGDIEIANPDGVKDTWLNDVWSGRTVTILCGDVRWPKSEFMTVFSGVVEDIAARSTDRLNLLLRDKSQRLNVTITEATVGGTGTNKDVLLPLCFGEVHNITPVLIDKGTLTYQVHNGAIERVIEVRDNGVPVNFAYSLANGTFTLSASPVGTITASVQGSKAGATYRTKPGALIQHIVTTYGKQPLTTSDLDTTQLATFDAAHTQTIGLYLDSRANLLETVQSIAASVGAQVCFTPGGLLQIQKIALPAVGTPTAVQASDIVNGSLSVVDSPKLQPAVRLAYCRNHTVQEGLQTGLPAEHLDMYGREWLLVQAGDTATATTWNMSIAPEQVETLLQTRAETEAEAARRLTLWGSRRLVLGFSTIGGLLRVNLGSALTLTHSRFGLSAGKTGQVIGKTTDWLGHKVNFEVLI
jgi:hypothetical protein